MLSRRRFLTVLGAAGAALTTGPSFAQAALPKVVVAKDPNCGCCGGWVEHMKAAGFPVDVVTTPEVNRVKVRLGVPDELASCHTAEVGGYVIEGHVPADAVKRLLAEKPQAKGLAVPGMPVGSPGMEVAGVENDTYDVVLFGPSGQKAFARYEGARLL
ncbi:DUF411 domain-containing protein [Microvirga arsenatis]|uniref:Twin-arginine translocation signal domain-containing protein n=1 Tax=Microvirga arsenatis TaxID=2692265 RepID=A0ABW9YTV6_9HYPH|nr:DUF411 domain-containing protein [Microvirga arsenatis]NBJ09456.1 twin-arginine translocation signal domain-containing protein [Microvirga arsenatis]NBJ23686.1 twin-arginine translocation signal domain-containing protein [Microvirga arsenatis]